MGIDKKVSTKYYLNTNLKPHIDEEGRELYPIYVRVTFNRNNTKFRIYSPGAPISIREDLNQSVWVQEIDSIIIRLVEKGYMERGDNYSLKGLNKIVRTYSVNFNKQLEIDFTSLLSAHLKKSLTYNEFVLWTNHAMNRKVCDALKTIYPNSDYESFDRKIKAYTVALVVLNDKREKCLIGNWILTDMKVKVKNDLSDLQQLKTTKMLFGCVPTSKFVDSQLVDEIIGLIDACCSNFIEWTKDGGSLRLTKETFY